MTDINLASGAPVRHAAAPAAAEVILDSCPKITGGGYGISGPLRFLTGDHDYDEAVRFVVPAGSGYTLDHVRVTLDWVWGHSRAISLCLMSDVAADTVPGDVLACAQPLAIGTTDPIDVYDMAGRCGRWSNECRRGNPDRTGRTARIAGCRADRCVAPMATTCARALRAHAARWMRNLA